jgi:hypothetical protein
MSGTVKLKDGTEIWPEYPGPPLLLAMQAMHAFKNADDALAPTDAKNGLNYSKIVSSEFVSGAGDCAYAASEVIARIKKGNRSTPEALWQTIRDAASYAHWYWNSLTGPGSGNHEKSHSEGVRQMNKAEREFCEMALKWVWDSEKTGLQASSAS